MLHNNLSPEHKTTEIISFDDLKRQLQLAESSFESLLIHSPMVDSIEKLKELFTINFAYAAKLLTTPEIKKLIQKKEVLQKIISFEATSTSFVPYGAKPVPHSSFIDSLPLNITLEFLKDEEIKRWIKNTSFILDNQQLLVKSIWYYQKIIAENPDLAIELASTDHVVQLFNYQTFYNCAEAREPLLQRIAMGLAKNPLIARLFTNEEQFLSFTIRPLIAKRLLNHRTINQMVAEKVKNSIDFATFLHDFPVIPAREMKEDKTASLDLAAPLPPLKKTDKSLDFMAGIMENTSEENARKFAAKQFMTVRSYFDHMMFGGKSGYYSSGRVDFEKDFITYASRASTEKALASAFAYQLLMIRKKLIDSHELLPNEPFNVLEGGAGNGNLCFNILSIIRDMAESHDSNIANIEEWKELHKTIAYHIVERSPELVKSQIKKNQIFIDANQLRIVQADARHLAKALPDKRMAAVISNELLDVFPPQKLTMNQQGEIDIVMILPALRRSAWQTAKEFFTPEDFKEMTAELEKNSEHYIEKFKLIFKKFEPCSDEFCYLSKKDFYRLHEMLVDKQKFKKAFDFITFNLSSDYFIKVKEFIAKNKPFFDRMHPGESVLVTIGMDNFLKNIADILITNGEIISVDYGNNGYLRDKRLRTFQNSVLGYNIFDEPGYKDMTYDVNFTDLVKRAEAFGVKLLYFGNQAHMLPDTIYFPENILSAKSRRFFSENPNSPTFKVCVQYKSSPAPLLETKVHLNERFATDAQSVTYSEIFNDYMLEMAFPDYKKTMLKPEEFCDLCSDPSHKTNRLIKYLFKKTSPAEQEIWIGAHDFQALKEAASQGNKELMEFLFDKASAEQKQKMLSIDGYILAIHTLSPNMFTKFLFEKASPEQKNLMITAKDFQNFYRAAVLDNKEMMLFFIKNASPPQKENMIAAKEFRTFRILASQGNDELIKFLFENFPAQKEAMIAAKNFEFFNELKLLEANKKSHKIKDYYPVITLLLSESRACFNFVEKEYKDAKFFLNYINALKPQVSITDFSFVTTTPRARKEGEQKPSENTEPEKTFGRTPEI